MYVQHHIVPQDTGNSTVEMILRSTEDMKEPCREVYSAVQYRCTAVQYSIEQYCKVLNNTIQYSTEQCIAVQYSYSYSMPHQDKSAAQLPISESRSQAGNRDAHWIDYN
jgi:hypothetical protein